MGTYRDYTPFEEKLNFLTHLIALVFYILACPYLIIQAANMPQPINIAGLIVYSIGLVAVFASSSLYHYTTDKALKTKFRTLDHMAIYLLIGGTYTPVINRYIESQTGTIFLTILWLILISGVMMKFFFMGRFKAFSIGLYVFLGCMVLFLIKPIVANMPDNVFIYILSGGIAYLVGTLFYINKKTAYTHTIWHVFVVVASFLHFMAIYKTAMHGAE